MKHSLRYPAALAALVLASLTAQAQTEPIKFGKPDPKDFTAAPFVGDSAAAAVVLCDYGTTTSSTPTTISSWYRSAPRASKS